MGVIKSAERSVATEILQLVRAKIKVIQILASCVLILSIYQPLFSQHLDRLKLFDEKRQNHQKSAMLTLGTWATINITSGLILQNNTSGTDKYFHQMNAGWNAVNLGIAALGYWRASQFNSPDRSFSEAWKKYEGYQKSLLFNAGLDVGYMAGGLYLIERSRRYDGKKADQRKGWGQSILLQGAFLFTFDLVAYLSSRKLAKNVRPYMILDAPTQSTQIGIHFSF